MKPELSIVMPCYNESRNIPVIVERLAKFYPVVNFELVLVDNGSTDNSAEVLEAIKKRYEFIKVAMVEKNIGYGHGILTGLKACSADILSYTHADIQTPPEDIFKAYDILKEKKNDMEKVLIKGFRMNRAQEETFLTKSLLKTVGIILGQKLEDINGQPKLFSRELLEKFKSPPVGFSFDIYVMYVAKIMGFKCITFPVDFGQRIHGQSKWATSILSKYKTILKYIASIFKIAIVHFNAPENTIRQLVRFLITGIFTNLTNYFVFFVLLHWLRVYYVLSSAAGFLAGFIVGFIVNRSWTFSVKDRGFARSLKFFALNTFSLGVNMLTIWVFTEFVKIIPEISQVIAIGVSTVINFTGSKWWVFKKDEKA